MTDDELLDAVTALARTEGEQGVVVGAVVVIVLAGHDGENATASLSVMQSQMTPWHAEGLLREAARQVIAGDPL